MSNAAYAKGIKHLLDGSGLAWGTGNWKAVLCDATYVVDLVNDEFLADIASGKRVATSPNLTTMAVADDGIFTADDVTFSAVTGAACPTAVIYHDSGSAATSQLLLMFDSLAGLPITPNSRDVVLAFATGTDGLFHI